jgi:hypothetical protein
MCEVKSKCLKCNQSYVCYSIHINGKHRKGLCNNCTDDMLKVFNGLPAKEQFNFKVKQWLKES